MKNLSFKYLNKLLKLIRCKFIVRLPIVGAVHFDWQSGAAEYNYSVVKSQKNINKEINFVNTENFLTQIDKQGVCIGLNANPLCSWLPYFQGRTAVYINNFFGTNYAIRSPVLVQITLFNKGVPQGETHSVWLHNGQSYFYDQLFETASHEESFIYIQMYNPMIGVNHGGSGYLGGYIRVHGLIYKGPERNSASVVHSMPVSEPSLKRFREGRYIKSPRAFMPQLNAEKKYNLVAIDPLKFAGESSEMIFSDGVLLLKQTSELTMPCIVSVVEKEVRAIWHDGPDLSLGVLASNAKKISASQGIWIPRFKVNAPWLFFSKENHASTSTSACIKLQQSGRHFESKRIDLSAMPFFVDTRILFPDATDEPASLFIVFYDNPIDCVNSLLVNVIFRDGSGEIGDVVHTASGFDLSTKPVGRPLAMRIWGPYIKMEGVVFAYTLVNTMDHEQPSDIVNAVKMRVITDRQYEFILNIDLVAGNDIFTITSDEINKLFCLDSKAQMTASIQFESSKANLQGNFYILGPNGEVGVDHLTGG